MLENKNLKDNICDFIEERLHESYSRLNKNIEYKSVYEKHINVLEDLESKLSNNTELLDLLDNFCTAEIDLHALELEDAYKIGFLDSISILTDKGE